MDRQPTLTGDTITLRPLTAADRDGLRRAADDPLIWEQHPADRHEPEQFAAFFDEALRSGGALVVLNRDGEIIGTSRFHDERDSSVEIGWSFLARRFWGGVTNREMKTLMLNHAFEAVDRVRFRVAVANLRSQRAVEKLGARPVDSGGDDGNVAYELTRRRWQDRLSA